MKLWKLINECILHESTTVAGISATQFSHSISVTERSSGKMNSRLRKLNTSSCVLIFEILLSVLFGSMTSHVLTCPLHSCPSGDGHDQARLKSSWTSRHNPIWLMKISLRQAMSQQNNTMWKDTVFIEYPLWLSIWDNAATRILNRCKEDTFYSSAFYFCPLKST